MYATLPEFKAYRKISDDSEDALLITLLENAQGFIEAYCRRSFEAEADRTRYFDPTRQVCGRELRLDRDLCAITTVTNGDGVAISTGQYVTEPRNAFADGEPAHALTLKANAGALWTHSGTPENAIAITGRWAYSISASPLVKQCTLLTASYSYEQRRNVGDLGRSFITDAGTVLAAALPKDLFTQLTLRRRGEVLV